MRKQYFTDNFVYFINILVSISLLISYTLSYFFAEQLSYLQVFSLLEPILIVFNLMFIIYWIFRKIRKIILPLLTLLIGIGHLQQLYGFSKERDFIPKQSIRIMSYNVRLFNTYHWIKRDDIPKDIIRFVNKEKADILCLQEFHTDWKDSFAHYPYKFVYRKSAKNKIGLAIFSKYPILKSGSLHFPNTFNNTIYADLKIRQDTVRLYNIHLESLRLDTNPNHFETEQSPQIIDNIARRFVIQKQQAEIILQDIKQTTYKKIVSGDLNNTAFSYVYRQLKNELVDSFDHSGSGFGATYFLWMIPLRIDFILVDKAFDIIQHTNYNIGLSDHEPLSASIGFPMDIQ